MPIPAEGGKFTDTTTGTSALRSSCGGDGAPEKVYAWTPTVSGTATLSTCGSSLNTVVYLLQGSCDTSSPLACGQSSCGSEGGSSLNVSVTAGETYYIVVDGVSGGGSYTLTVTPPTTSVADALTAAPPPAIPLDFTTSSYRFAVGNGQTRSYTLTAPSVFSQYIPLCLVDTYYPAGDDDMKFWCTVSGSGSSRTFTISVRDGNAGGFIRGNLILLAGGSSLGHVQRSFSLPNNHSQTFTLPAVTGPRLSPVRWTLPEVTVYDACRDDDMEWLTTWAWTGVQPRYTVTHTGGGCTVAGSAHLFGFAPSIRVASDSFWVRGGSSVSRMMYYAPGKRVLPFVAISRYDARGDDDMSYTSSWTAVGASAFRFDFRVASANSNSGVGFMAYLIEY